MRPLKRISTLIFAVLLSAGVATGVHAQPDETGESLTGKLPSSSRCLAECDVMQAKCEALELEFPTCGAADVCIEEKQNCVARCNLTAMFCPARPGKSVIAG